MSKTYRGKSLRPGGGGRFARLEDVFNKQGDIENPGALVAAIGRKKFGQAQMTKWSAAGRKRSR